MKVLGISLGRVGGNSEMLLKAALKSCEDAGNEVELVRLHDYYIKPCSGCELCTKLFFEKKPPRCSYGWDEDDFKFLIDEIKSANGLILAAPCYHLMPPGIGTDLLNRIHSAQLGVNEGVAALGDISKRKISAIIGVGGSDWTSMMMTILGFITTELTGSQMNMCDKMLVTNTPAKYMVGSRPEALERAALLGQHVSDELVNPGNVNYYGNDFEESCPICHCDLLQFRNGRVACPICDYEGDPVIENGKIRMIKWDGGMEATRWSKFGVQHHDDEMQKDTVLEGTKGYRFTDEQKALMEANKEKWANYLQPLKPGPRVK